MTARNMGKNDVWIAATAYVLRATLVTTDKDFWPLATLLWLGMGGAMNGLRVGNSPIFCVFLKKNKGSLTNPVKWIIIWAYPPPYQSGVGLSGTLSTPLSLRYVQTTPTIPYARDEQSRGRKTNNHEICQRTQIIFASFLIGTRHK